MTDDLPTAPATARNREPILELLRRVLPERGTVLEVAASTGEHGVFFARGLPELLWRPTDYEPAAVAVIAERRRREGTPNLLEPERLDAARPETWPVGRVDAVVCVNMVHISPWAATLGLMRGAGERLPDGAPLVLYGPFRIAGRPFAPSNEAFDADLRARDPAWGVRELDAVAAAAAAEALDLAEVVDLPANNHGVVFRRRARSPAP